MAHFPFNLHPLLIHGGEIENIDDRIIRLTLPPHSEKYCDAQLDDYQFIPRKRFHWSPPCQMKVRARASLSDLPGTLGFGFWNDPFTLSIGQGGAARRFPVPPQTLWFFNGSQENDIRLNPEHPGCGWKAWSIRSPRVPGLILAPIAILAIASSSIPFLRSVMMRMIQRIVKSEEVLLSDSLDQWHIYDINWGTGEASFLVDGIELLRVNHPPPGPLGFVAWIDNQYAHASPESRFRFGVVPSMEEQWLEIEILRLSKT
jgi:hypothetical protein